MVAMKLPGSYFVTILEKIGHLSTGQEVKENLLKRTQTANKSNRNLNFLYFNQNEKQAFGSEYALT